MLKVCAYCGCQLSQPVAAPEEPTSHGMCGDCYHHFTRQWDGLPLGEYLDRFAAPVALVSSSGRIIAANQRLADRIGKSARDLHGLLGGDAFECQFARLPGGCGKTTHCATCTIRNTVMATMETGQETQDAEAYLNRADGQYALRIGARKVGETVLLTVFAMSPVANADPADLLTSDRNRSDR